MMLMTQIKQHTANISLNEKLETFVSFLYVSLVHIFFLKKVSINVFLAIHVFLNST
jgi:hypothetical protein